MPVFYFLYYFKLFGFQNIRFLILVGFCCHFSWFAKNIGILIGAFQVIFFILSKRLKLIFLSPTEHFILPLQYFHPSNIHLFQFISFNKPLFIKIINWTLFQPLFDVSIIYLSIYELFIILYNIPSLIIPI